MLRFGHSEGVTWQHFSLCLLCLVNREEDEGGEEEWTSGWDDVLNLQKMFWLEPQIFWNFLFNRWFTRSYAWAAPPSPSAIVNLRRCWPITQLHFMTKSAQLYIIVWRLFPFEIKSRRGSNETVRLTEESIISSCSSSHRGERHVCQIFAYFPSRWK